jgi:hypothetical protein
MTSFRIGRWILLPVALLMLYGAATGYMYVFQRNFVFKPTGTLASPMEKGLENVTVESVPMRDGKRMTVWRAVPGREGAPTVLYFHGNSSNLSGRWKRFKEITDSGMGLYAPTYRGYAGGEGTPSETALIADALEHFDRASENASGIILHGESLGTGVASAVAANRDAKALILEAPYTAAVDIAAAGYPWLPVALLMKDPFLSRERIIDVSEPLLIIHGTDDAVIPFEHGQALYQLANEPKKMATIEGAGHGDLWTKGLWSHVTEFLDHVGVSASGSAN